MTPNDIKAEITRRGTTQKAIAVYLGVCSGTVGKVITGKCRSRKVEDEIERIVGHKVFPPAQRTGRQPSVWRGAAVEGMRA